MARLLLHTLVFPPDGVSTSTILSELTQDLQSQGHEIVILTTRPHYNRDPEAERHQPLHSRMGGLYSVSDHHGMRVLHTWMPRKGAGTSGRMRDYMVFHILSLIVGLFLIGRCEVVLVPSPPLSTGVIGWMLARLKGAKFVYNIQELYPALALQLGLTTPDSTMYKLMAHMERFVYARADHLTVICEDFRQHVLRLGVFATKISLIPNFVDVDFVRPLSKDNPLSNELGLAQHIVVLYAGNIGMTQSFDTILEVADRLRDQEQVRFLIVGDGARRAEIAEMIARKRTPNVILVPYQPRSVVPFIYATANLCLVPLMRGTAKTTIPSKIYTIMASGRPVLVSVDEDSELVSIVKQAACGISVPPDDADALEEALRYAFEHLSMMQSFGGNGRRYAESHYSRQAVSSQYHQLIEVLTGRSRKV